MHVDVKSCFGTVIIAHIFEIFNSTDGLLFSVLHFYALALSVLCRTVLSFLYLP